MPMDELQRAKYIGLRKKSNNLAKLLNIRVINEDTISCRLKKCNPHGRTDKFFDRKGQTIFWDEKGNIKEVMQGKWRSHTYYSLEYRAKQSRLGRVRTQIKKQLSQRITNHIVVSVGKSALSQSDVKDANKRFHASKHGRFM